MKNLIVEIQGIKGKEKHLSTEGSIKATCANYLILIDNFQGAGKDYKQREDPLITLSHNGEDYFAGTFKELKHRLKPEE